MCFFRKPKVEPETIKPTSTRKASFTEVFQLIAERFPDCPIYLSDNEYLLCSYDDIALFLAQDQTNKMEYQSEVYDCDNFSYRLMGQFSIPGWSALAFGIVWSANHAFNVFISEDKKLLFVEPQDDSISENMEGDLRFIIM